MTRTPKTSNRLTLSERLLPLIHELSAASAITNDLCTVGNLVLDLAVKHTGARRGSLMLLDDSNRLSILASRGLDLQFHDGPPVRVGEGVAGVVAQGMAPVLVKDISSETLFSHCRRDCYETNSFICCPIASRNRLLGVLNVSDKENGEAFDEEDFELLKIVSNQAAVVIENALLVDQLKVKSDDLQSVNRKLIESDIAKTEFLTRVSHELRTPLNSMKGAIHYLMLSEKAPPRKQKLFHSIISQETMKLIQTVEGLLDSLRTEGDTTVPDKSILFLPDVLKDVMESPALKSLLGRKSMTVALECAEDVSTIVGDKIMVTQIFANLIEALTHSLRDGDDLKVRISENDSVTVRLEPGRELPDVIPRQLSAPEFSFRQEQPEHLLKLHLVMKAVEAHDWRLYAEPAERPEALVMKIHKSEALTVETIIAAALHRIVEFAAELMDLTSCAVMLKDDAGDLGIRSAVGMERDTAGHATSRPGEAPQGLAALEQAPRLILDPAGDAGFSWPGLSRYNMKSLISVPLKTGAGTVGLMIAGNRKDGAPLTERDLAVAAMLGERVANFLNSVYSARYNEADLKKLLASLDRLLQACRSSAKKGTLLQEVLGLLLDRLKASGDDKSVAFYASAVYDLGLAHMNNFLLARKDLLPPEQRVLRLHPYSTLNLLDKFEFSGAVKRVILHHHENWDGTGYPAGLRGSEIPFLSRVIAVADSFCAMITERPHKPALPPRRAIAEMRRDAGSRYDPRVVEAFCETVPAWLESRPGFSASAGRA